MGKVIYPVLCLPPSPSSATGGADSRPTSEKGSPTEEQAGMVGNGNKSSASDGTRGRPAVD